MNEIIKLLNAMLDSDTEHQLFQNYTKARDTYLLEVRMHAKGQVSNSNIQKLFHAERDAFSSYLSHRISTKGL